MYASIGMVDGIAQSSLPNLGDGSFVGFFVGSSNGKGRHQQQRDYFAQSPHKLPSAGARREPASKLARRPTIDAQPRIDVASSLE
jgi:hypothetical protein